MLNWNGIDAVLLDLDGVLTPTAEVHRRAWADMFNGYLAGRPGQQPFTDEDYFAHVDGKPRYDGVRDFLASRGIELPEGDRADSGDAVTVCGLGNRKNDEVNRLLERDGVSPYPGSVLLLDHLAARGVRMAVVSSSRNAPLVLRAAGIADRFGIVVDGSVAEAQGLAGKPSPATYEYAAAQLGVPTRRSVVVEDAVSGVQAGAAGDFGLVLGVDRGVGESALLAAGADVVVSDLKEAVA